MALKLLKTAGVRVTRFVHDRISAGNAARDRGDKPAAINAYQAALARDPSLAHIWVQLGHMLKESGGVEEAAAAYEQAVSKGGPHGIDALLHLGHLEKSRGRTAQAARHFVRTSRLDPFNAAPLRELVDLLSLARAKGEISLGEVKRSLADLAPEGDNLTRYSVDQSGVSMLVMDCTMLVRAIIEPNLSRNIVWHHIELIDAVLKAYPDRAYLAHVHPGTGSLIELREQEYRDIRATLAHGHDGKSWGRTDVVNNISLAATLRDPLAISKDSWIIGLGLPEIESEYLLAFIEARNRSGARYAAIIDDLSPFVLPQFSSMDRRLAATTWLLSALNVAELFFASSSEVKSDLMRIADDAGIAPVHEKIAVVDLSAPLIAAAEVPRPLDQKLAGAAYALAIGEICGAKGHLIVLDAWLAIAQEHGANVPDLVLVGDENVNGSAAVMRRIHSNDFLSRKVKLVGKVNDEALGRLYDGAALVLCSTLYEGSNAILADARERGVPTIASDLPVLREGGGDVSFVPPGDAKALAAEIERQLFGANAPRASEVATNGKASRGSISDIVAELDRRAEMASHPKLPQAIPNRWHPFIPIADGEVKAGIGTGANFRSDSGWLPPDVSGCWTRPGGGEITIGLPQADRWRLSLQLRGLPTRATRWTLAIEGRSPINGSLDAGARTWVVIDDLDPSDGRVRLFVEGYTQEVVTVLDHNARRHEAVGSLGVTGFHVCRRDDWAARDQFLETLVLSELEALSAYA